MEVLFSDTLHTALGLVGIALLLAFAFLLFVITAWMWSGK